MQKENFKILVIDCDKISEQETISFLTKNGFEVFGCTSSDLALQLARETSPHMVILELMMPKTDGIDICYELKKELSNILIVFYTFKAEDHSQLAAYNAGADDYIIKPKRERILLCRINALLKRYNSSENITTNHSPSLFIDKDQYLVYKNGEKILLPKKEFELLSLLANLPKKVFSRKEISESIWGYEIDSMNRTIDVHIRRLRKKLGDEYIKTVKGLGYRLDV